MSVGFDDIVSAADRIRGRVHRTPVHTCTAIDERAGARVFLKCENFQRVGAFKIRGALNAMMQLSEAERKRGVIAYSSGNHGQGVALAAKLLGIPATIVMPSDAPRVKLDATRGYLEDIPGEVVIYDRATEVREEIGARIADERGLTIVPPYDHPHVIAGQGTAAMELVEDAGPLDLVLTPVGGGGLLSGSSIALKSMCPGARVIGVEPERADDAARSFRTKTLQTVHNPDTIADGARTPSLGEHTFPVILDRVDDMLTATEDEIVDAMRLVWQRAKLVIEPTAALPVAGLLKLRREGRLGAERIGVILSGGNVDRSAFAALLDETRSA